MCWICQNDDFSTNEKKEAWPLSVKWANSCFGRKNNWEKLFLFLDFLFVLFCSFFSFLKQTCKNGENAH